MKLCHAKQSVYWTIPLCWIFNQFCCKVHSCTSTGLVDVLALARTHTSPWARLNAHIQKCTNPDSLCFQSLWSQWQKMRRVREDAERNKKNKKPKEVQTRKRTFACRVYFTFMAVRQAAETLSCSMLYKLESLLKSCFPFSETACRFTAWQ